MMGWTQNDGSMQVAPPNLVTTEEEMIPTIKQWVYGIDQSQISQLFNLYPAPDFEDEKIAFEAAHPASPGVAVHWFRLSQMMRDILFTCPSIDFVHYNAHYSKSQGKQQSSTEDSYLYAFNQTLFSPLLEAGGMPHLGVCHGSDTNYVLNGVWPEAEAVGGMSAEDVTLSSSFSASLLRFAYGETPGLDDSLNSHKWLQNSMPGDVGIEIVGGPNPGSVVLRNDEDGAAGIADGVGAHEYVEGEQEFVYGTMGNKQNASRTKTVGKERLLERCAFINTLTKALQN